MHASECRRLAQSASSESARQAFNNLAETWVRLADELLLSQALLETWGRRGLDHGCAECGKAGQ
jgi:hypothetical protein